MTDGTDFKMVSTLAMIVSGIKKYKFVFQLVGYTIAVRCSLKTSIEILIAGLLKV